MIAAIDALPLWMTVLIAMFLVCGGIIVFIGGLGLLRLPNFYQRIHAPAIAITFGAGSLLIASMLYFSALEARPVIHELLITLFIFLTAPITSMLIMRAAVYREMLEGKVNYVKQSRPPTNNQTGK